MNIGKGSRVARKRILTCIRLMECKISELFFFNLNSFFEMQQKKINFLTCVSISDPMKIT